METNQPKVSDHELIWQSLEMPGEMGPHSYFYEYSLGNQAYLWMQGARGFIGKYKDWPKVGRHVLAGSKASEIIRPHFIKVECQDDIVEEVLVGWMGSRCIFTYSQTEGEPIPPIQIPK